MKVMTDVRTESTEPLNCTLTSPIVIDTLIFVVFLSFSDILSPMK
jgi:hypothetical protein